MLLVLDLEATCDEERGSINPQETIEIGVVAVELKAPPRNTATTAACSSFSASAVPPPPPPPRLPRLLGPAFTFHSHVRPTEHPRLTEFCINLTGVRQEQVDAAPQIAEVIASLEDWVVATGLSSRRLLAVTWSNNDLGLLLGREMV